MSEYEQVIDEIVKHGVTVKVNKIFDDNYIPYERKYVGCVVELDFSEHDKVFEDKISSLEENVGYYKDCLLRVEKNCDKLHHENKELKQRISKMEEKNKNLVDMINELQLEKAYIDCDLHNANKRIAELKSKETGTCNKEPISDDCKPSMEWYDNRHQSDCIEINRLNTTIDVLIHKIEHLRQFAGLE